MMIKTIFGIVKANGYSRVPPETFKAFKEFKRAGIVPLIIPRPPPIPIKIKFHKAIQMGHPISPNFCLAEPTSIHWKSSTTDETYSLFFLNVDYPDPHRPTGRSYQHWVVVNIPGDAIVKGNHVTEYIGPTPQRFTGFHRFVFLIYKQKRKINTEHIKHLHDGTNTGRPGFNLQEFITTHDLMPFPDAGLFFISEYDTMVGIVEKKLQMGLLHEQFLTKDKPAKKDPCATR